MTDCKQPRNAASNPNSKRDAPSAPQAKANRRSGRLPKLKSWSDLPKPTIDILPTLKKGF